MNSVVLVNRSSSNRWKKLATRFSSFCSGFGPVLPAEQGDRFMTTTLVNIQKPSKTYGKSPLFMGKSTISTGPCSSKLLVYQGVMCFFVPRTIAWTMDMSMVNEKNTLPLGSSSFLCLISRRLPWEYVGNVPISIWYLYELFLEGKMNDDECDEHVAILKCYSSIIVIRAITV